MKAGYRQLKRLMSPRGSSFEKLQRFIYSMRTMEIPPSSASANPVLARDAYSIPNL